MLRIRVPAEFTCHAVNVVCMVLEMTFERDLLTRTY